MRPTKILWLSLICMLFSACSPNTNPPLFDTGTVPDLEEDIIISCLGAVCQVAADCAKTGPCLSATSCLDNCCSYKYMPEGTACETPCAINGSCNSTGECTDTESLLCEDEDGNPCTVPTCDSGTGLCGAELPVADGSGGMESYCWDGLVCKDGALDETAATPTQLYNDCTAQDAGLNPLGCIDQVVCVDSEPECVVMLKDEGTQCWGGGGGQDETCPGQSCSLEGECLSDETFTVECDNDSWPEECTEICRECTELTCHWIEDPSNPGAAKRVKYCKPEANVGGGCSDGNGCTIDDICVLGSQADGPKGKETLGECQSGEGKTKEECLADMDKPALSCLKAGVSCDEDAGCTFDQDEADSWCHPPDSVCFNEAKTYCSHQDFENDGLWNEETGCHVVIFDQEGCDDGNPCTDDICNSEGGCENPPLEDTSCDDNNSLTVDDQCNNGVCVGLPDPDEDGVANSGYGDSCTGSNDECNDNCPDIANPTQDDANGDGIGDACACDPDCDGKECGSDGCDGTCGMCDDSNPCSDDICLDAGLCSYVPTNEGVLCVGDGLCVGKCNNGQCVESAVETCNGQDDDCDNLIDEDPNLCQQGWTCQNGGCVENCVPIDGGWTNWVCGACDADCGGGLQACTRTCNNPLPSCGGQVCSGGGSKNEACNLQQCENYLPTGTTTYSLGEQVVTGKVPSGKTSIQFKLWGAGGAGGFPGHGGGGAYVAGTLAVQPGDDIELRVGSGGKAQCSGGGASYIFRNGQVAMVAGGGGGSGSDGSSNSQNLPPSVAAGGGGGPLNGSGQNGTETTYLNTNSGGGTGGSQVTGGTGGISNNQSQYSNCTLNGEAGSAHTGGSNGKGQCQLGGAASYEKGGSDAGGNGTGGGGGAGYFGGGGGACMWTYSGGGGGGGSSWVNAGQVSGTSSDGGTYQTPGGTGIGGYINAAGRGGTAGDWSDWPTITINPEDGKPGLVILTL
jgi:hypothetical protein